MHSNPTTRIMEQSVDCPFCDNIAVLSVEKEDLIFREKSYTVDYYFYACGECGQEFTTSETDTKTLDDLYNQANFNPE